jgi:tetratricopeptide (TPR) repeat protein
MISKLSNWCDNVLEASWLTAVVAIPLFFNIHSSRVFEPDKLTLLRSIALVMIAVWLVKFIDQQGWRNLGRLHWQGEQSLWRVPFALPVLLVVLAYLVSSIFSMTPAASWLGSYQRLQGTYTTFSYITVFALMAATIRSRAQVERALTAVILTSIPVALYAILQRHGLDPLPWGGDTQRRVAGHMGNAIFIAAYLIMAVPVTAARILDAFTNIMSDVELSWADVTRASIYIFTLFIQIAAIYWTFSRGPWLGLAVGMFAFGLILLVSLRNSEKTPRPLAWTDGLGTALTAVAAVILPLFLISQLIDSAANPTGSLLAYLALVFILMFATLGVNAYRRGWRRVLLDWIAFSVLLAGLLVFFNLSADVAPGEQPTLTAAPVEMMDNWREIPGVGRIGRLLEADSGTGRVRVLIWDGALELVTNAQPLQLPDGREDSFSLLRPFIGYGPESMYVTYNRFYPPELATVEARNASPDRAHNETFDALAITGLLGFLAWQLLYLAVFYYSFRWLGVVRSGRERAFFIAVWIGGAILFGVLFSLLRSPSYLGVAAPFGSIAGLALYLIYYALFAPAEETDAAPNPFAADRLMLIALVAAITAYYVEIHFGIAIAATRLHFFVYLALILLIGHLLPQRETQNEAAPVAVKQPASRRRAAPPTAAAAGWFGPIMAQAMLLGLLLGVLCYQYMTFALPPGRTIQQLSDVPSPGEIFHQSLFINASQNFADSPYIFLVVCLTWALGALVMVSEMSKRGELSLGASKGELSAARQMQAGAALVVTVIGSFGLRFLETDNGDGVSRLVGGGLLLIWAGLATWGALSLFLKRPSAQQTGGFIAMAGLVIALPAIVAGGMAAAFGLLNAVVCLVVLYLLWDSAWDQFLIPAATLALMALIAAFIVGYLQANQIRATIIGPQWLPPGASDIDRRIMEADLSASLLTFFYIAVFSLIFLHSLFLTIGRWGQSRLSGSAPAFAALLVLLPLAFYLTTTTNLRVIQADIVYKRADFWDKQASSLARSDTEQAAQAWNYAIAIYEHALNLAPNEDFYYLFLGRAYLEKASLTPDQAEQAALLRTARDRLQEAQRINPLNTDHTANLARLHTRWSEIAAEGSREELVETALAYYQDAVALSPQNVVIWNEYARLVYFRQNDCEEALRLFRLSAETDPFYAETQFNRAEIAAVCSYTVEGEAQIAWRNEAIEALTDGLNREPDNPRRLMQAAEVYTRRLRDGDLGLAAYEEARALATDNLPAWQMDITVAQWFVELGDIPQAIALAERALADAPPDSAAQIRAFITQLSGQGGG